MLAGYPGWDAVVSDHPELARLRLEDPIHFQPPGGESGADVLAPVIAGRRTVVVTDAAVRDAHLPRLATALDRLNVRWDTVTIPAGEDTNAHAVETEAGHGALPHGEAVAAGLAAAAALSAKLGYCNPGIVDRVRRHLRATGLPHRIAALASNRAWDPGAILGHMAHDKKTVGGRVHFVLLRGIGAPFVDGTVPEDAVLEVLEVECAPYRAS